jgi:hypothetical protein
VARTRADPVRPGGRPPLSSSVGRSPTWHVPSDCARPSTRRRSRSARRSGPRS